MKIEVDGRLRIEEIAGAAGISPSSLHAHFKAITRMTPLDYQKQLRLQEARRLMLVAGASAGSARLRGRLRQPIAVQPRGSSPVRRAPAAGYRATAGRP